MSAMKFYVSASILAIPIAAAINTAIPNGGPIVVHSLTYADGQITQDRTVAGDGGVTLMTWGAQIVDASTGQPVAGCTGSGTWPYEQGRVAFTMPVATWVGSETCSLSAGEYYPRAVYSDGNSEPVTETGAVFEVTE